MNDVLSRLHSGIAAMTLMTATHQASAQLAPGHHWADTLEELLVTHARYTQVTLHGNTDADSGYLGDKEVQLALDALVQRVALRRPSTYPVTSITRDEALETDWADMSPGIVPTILQLSFCLATPRGTRTYTATHRPPGYVPPAPALVVVHG